MGDSNGDGRVEVIGAGGTALSRPVLRVWKAVGNGELVEAWSVADATWGIVSDMSAGDFDRDGDMDLIMVGGLAYTTVDLNSYLTVWYGKGDMTFNPVPVAGPGPPATARFADVDGDQNRDVVVGGSEGNLEVLLGDGSGNLGPAMVFQSSSFVGQFALADLGGNGHLDVVTGRGAVLAGDGRGQFREVCRYEAGGSKGGDDVAIGDVDSDGSLDAVFTAWDQGGIAILFGDGRGGFARRCTLSAGRLSRRVVLADVNGDKAPDIIVANFGSFDVSVFIGDGCGQFAPQVAVPVGSGLGSAASGWPGPIATADLDGDGILDIVTGNGLDYTISLLLSGPASGTGDADAGM